MNSSGSKAAARESADRGDDAEARSALQRSGVGPRRQTRNFSETETTRYKKPHVYCIRNMVIVIMNSGGGFCFSGKLSVRVLHGSVRVYGAILNASDGVTEVYSPRGYSNVAVETSETFAEGTIEDVWTALSAEGITRDSESTLQINIDKVRPGTAILLLRNIENSLTLFLKSHCRFKLFPNVKNAGYHPWTKPKRAEVVLQAHLNFAQRDDLTNKQLIVDPCIATSVAEKLIARWRANEWSCALIAGGKNVGKSTGVRCLVNSLLRTSKKVVLIDVDPGQAECTPAGCVSYSLIEQPLMGPNFTHLRQPIYQLFIDEINVSNCVTRYLDAIRMLIEKLRACPILSRLPIVVNTMGFTQYIGWDIAIFTIKLIRPSIVLQIMSKKTKYNFANLLSVDVVNKQECTWTFCDENYIDWNRPCDHELCTLYSHAENKTQANDWNMEPYQQRELVMMSYLSGILCNNNDDFLHYNMGLSLNINEVVPYTAPFSSLCIIPQRLFGVPTSHALSVINGNIVALCGIDVTEEPPQNSSESTSSLRVLTQRSPLCTCYGFGIIRGVDTERQQVFINTPLPLSIMQHVNCLAGCIPIPPALLQLQLNQGAPYVGENVTSNKLPTSREPRKGYFRMKYEKKPINPNKTSV